MKTTQAILAMAFTAAACLACGKNPVEQESEPQLILSPDSVVVAVSESSPLTVEVRGASGSIHSASLQYVSRAQSVATVNANGAITGVGAGSTYVVASLTSHAHVRDSVRVRVQAPPPVHPDSSFVAALRAHLEAATAAGQFSGAVLVARNGHTLFEGAYGLADRERGIANTPLTQFRVGSMNKMMTAVAALQLVQAGALRLDVSLGTYLTDYPNADLASKVTPHHLLTHTGGTGDIFGPEFMNHRSELRTVSDYLRLYGTRDLQFEPGAMWAYSNYGFMLLGALIERVGGTSYYDHVATRVLAPAGMMATNFAPEDSLVPARAVGYTKQLVPGSLVSNAPTLPYRGTPAGGGYSTVGDFARFAAAIREHRLLNAEHTKLLLAGKVATGPVTQYAYGFFTRIVGDRFFVGHGGGAPGMYGVLHFEPNGGYVVVVLSNFDYPRAREVENFILERLPATPAGGGS